MLALRPYQNQAVDFIYERDRSMVLAPVGAGKTAITLTAMREFKINGVVKRWLIVAPKRVCTDVWPVEAPKWAPDLTFAVAVGGAAKRRAAIAADVDAVVINYDVLDAVGDDFKRFDGIVFDELTRLKNLPKLTPTNIVDGREARVHKMPPSADRWKERSRTYQGIANAMAAQWG